MAYITGENLIATVIKAHDDFSATNVFQAKWTHLNKGKSRFYAILKSGGSVPLFITPNVYQTHHNTIIEVWVRYKNDGETATTLYGYVDKVKVLIQNAEKLGDTAGIIQNSTVESIGPVMEMWLGEGGPAWLKQEIIVSWHEQTKST